MYSLSCEALCVSLKICCSILPFHAERYPVADSTHVFYSPCRNLWSKSKQVMAFRHNLQMHDGTCFGQNNEIFGHGGTLERSAINIVSVAGASTQFNPRLHKSRRMKAQKSNFLIASSILGLNPVFFSRFKSAPGLPLNNHCQSWMFYSYTGA